MYWYVLVCTDRVIDIVCDVPANTAQSIGYVRLDINLPKPSRIEFQDQDLAPLLALPHGQSTFTGLATLSGRHEAGRLGMDWRKSARRVGVP